MKKLAENKTPRLVLYPVPVLVRQTECPSCAAQVTPSHSREVVGTREDFPRFGLNLRRTRWEATVSADAAVVSFEPPREEVVSISYYLKGQGPENVEVIKRSSRASN